MTVTASSLHSHLAGVATRLGRSAPTLSQVSAALASIDQATYLNGHLGRMAVETWDGISPINGASPSYVKDAHPWADKIYLIRIDGKIVYLQSHQPDIQGIVQVTAANLASISGAHVNQIATSRADGDVISQVMAALGLSGG